MAFDLGYVYCTNVSYEAVGFAWGATAYSSAAEHAFDCATAGYTWVTIRADEFFPIYNAAISGSGGGSASTSQFTAEEVSALKYQAANPSPFNLSVSEGGAIAAAVVVLWALAWGIRSVRKAVDSDKE